MGGAGPGLWSHSPPGMGGNGPLLPPVLGLLSAEEGAMLTSHDLVKKVVKKGRGARKTLLRRPRWVTVGYSAGLAFQPTCAER